jgi:hypothetical protein
MLLWICFIEPDTERTQEFTLQWSTDQTDALRPLIQQQWNFNPTGSIIQIEDHEVLRSSDASPMKQIQIRWIRRGSSKTSFDCLLADLDCAPTIFAL